MIHLSIFATDSTKVSNFDSLSNSSLKDSTKLGLNLVLPATNSSSSISSTISGTSPINPSKKIDCEGHPQIKVKIDCKSYFGCIKSKEKYALQIFSCSKGEYFSEESSSCRKSTNDKNNCDLLNKNLQSNSTTTTNRKKGLKKRKNKSKLRKRNRSLNPNGVLTLSLDDFDIDEEDDLVDFDRLSSRVNGRFSNKVKNSHIIVITGDEDSESFDESYEGSFMEGKIVNENEQTEDSTREDDKLDEKKITNDLPCNKKKDELNLINGNDKEIIVRNLTEVHNHINNTIINIMPTPIPDRTNGYLSPKEKLNKRKENDTNQQHETSENYGETNEADRPRRVPKNVTETDRKDSKNNMTESSSDKRKELNNLNESNSSNNKPVENASDDNFGKRRIHKNITTIITEEEESNNSNTNRNDQNKPKERDNYQSNNHDSKIIIKNSTSTNSADLVNKENGNNAINEHNSNGRRIVTKNVTTIITEEEEANNKKHHQNGFKPDDKPREKELTNDQSDQKNQSNKIVSKNVTTVITENNHRNDYLTNNDHTTSTISPNGNRDQESDENKFGKNRRVYKNVTTTIITEEEESNRVNGHKTESNSETSDQLEHTNQSRKPNESKNLVNEENTDGGRRIVTKNVTTIITEEEENKGVSTEKKDSKDNGSVSNQKITNTENGTDAFNPNRSSDTFNNGRKLVKNVTTTIITEEENSSKSSNSNLDKKVIQPFEENNGNSLSGNKVVSKNVTTIEESEHNSSNHKPVQREKETEQPDNHNGRRIIKNITTVITEEESNSSKVSEIKDSNEQNIRPNRDNHRPFEDESNVNSVNKNSKIIKETNNQREDELNHNSDDTNVREKNLPTEQFHNGKRIIKNITTVITEEESNSFGSNSNTNKIKEDSNSRVIYPNEDDKNRLDQNGLNDNSSNSNRVVRKNVTIIEEGTNRKEQNTFDDKNSSNDPNVKEKEAPNQEFHNGKRIIKNITTVIEEEESNESNSSKASKKKDNENIVRDREPNYENNGRVIIKNQTIIEEKHSLSDKDSNSSNKERELEQANNQFNNGKKIIKNVTIITEEESNESHGSTGSNSINRQTGHDRESEINNSRGDKVDNENLSDRSPNLPCDSSFRNLRPIARIIETHHVYKTLFGSSFSSINNSFTRIVRKNVTKIIRPDNLDDATSMIIKNGSDYLVNEIHDIEEKVIFENSNSFANATRSPQNMTTRKPPNIIIEFTTRAPTSFKPITESLDKFSSVTKKPTSMNPFTDPSTNSDLHGNINSMHSTIDPHGSYFTPSTSPPIVSPNNNYVTSTTNSPLADYTGSEFNGKPQGPVYFDETGDCKYEGFHKDNEDKCGRKFYLCKLDENKKFTIEEFLCVPNQVFDLEKKYCVYENINSDCSKGLTNIESLSSELSTLITNSIANSIPKMRKIDKNLENESRNLSTNEKSGNQTSSSSSFKKLKPYSILSADDNLNKLLEQDLGKNVRVQPMTLRSRLNQVPQVSRGQLENQADLTINTFDNRMHMPYSSYFNPILPANPIIMNDRYASNYPFNPFNGYPLLKK